VPISPKDPISSNLRGKNLLFWIFIRLRLVEDVIIHIWVFYFIWSYCKTLYKIEKLFKLWRRIERPRILNFWTKTLISVPIFPKVLIPPKMLNIAKFFLEKNFQRYWTSSCTELIKPKINHCHESVSVFVIVLECSK
jgi:hypothetical protein